MAGHAKNTTTQYTHVLKQFKHFCTSQGHENHLSVPTHIGIEFLTSLFKDGKSYSTINSARSALSYFVHLNDDRNEADFGKHRLIIQFMKGIFKLRPSFPRHVYTWDISPVLNRLKTICNSNSALKELSLKCVTLIALVTGQRVQTLSAIEVGNCNFEQHKIFIRIDKVLKTSRSGFHTSIDICRFTNDLNLCPVECISTYINRTASLRRDKQLFISFHKPHRTVCSQTISRWISVMLKDCGINQQFSAHSTRSASTSKAATANVDINSILRTAGWSNCQTFATYYKKPIVDNNFGNAVLT